MSKRNKANEPQSTKEPSEMLNAFIPKTVTIKRKDGTIVIIDYEKLMERLKQTRVNENAEKTASEIVSEAYDSIMALKPTVAEIKSYAEYLKKNNGDYGVVTYSISKRTSEPTFLRLHDTRAIKCGGKIHIDVGFVDQEFKQRNDTEQYRNWIDTTHLMLDKVHCIEFVELIKKNRK